MQPTVLIASKSPKLAHTLQNLLTTHPTLSNTCQIKTVSVSLERTYATLVFQAEPPASAACAPLLESSKVYPLPTVGKVLIGRNPQCDIAVDAKCYEMVSWHHAEILPLFTADGSSGWQICDVKSRNGTYVNGDRLQGCHTLQPGDQITLAFPLLSPAVPGFTFDYQPWAENSARLVLQGNFKLTVRPKPTDHATQVRHELSSSKPTLMGRDPVSDIPLDAGIYKLVSWRHAAVEPIQNTEDGTCLGWQVRDLNSKNGTYLNGRKLRSSQTLQEGDRITLAQPTAGQSTPMFVFECYSMLLAEETVANLCTGSEVLCWAIAHNQAFSEPDQRLLLKLASQPCKRYLVVDIATPHLAEIEAWVENQVGAWELVSLPLADSIGDGLPPAFGDRHALENFWTQLETSLTQLCPSQASAQEPQEPLQINIEIDVARKDRQVAEIAEMPYFKQLERKGEQLRKRKEGNGE